MRARMMLSVSKMVDIPILIADVDYINGEVAAFGDMP
jgi:hypothetical protein